MPIELSHDSLRSAAAYAIDLLGERYAALLEADERGRASATPPLRRHRLVELIEYVHEAAELLARGPRGGELTLDGNLLSEFITLVSLFRRWSNHPVWPRLVTSLLNETEVQHSVMLLAVASYLADAGNGIGLVGDTEGGRIADLWAEPTILERLEVEVKTPQELRGPRVAPLTIEDAVRLIERQVNRAASTTRGQLRPEYSGILAIGGYHLGSGMLDMLETAGRTVLSRQAHRKGHLAGLVVAELSYELMGAPNAVGAFVPTSFSPSLSNRLIKHPGYNGGLEINEDEPPWREFSPPSPPASNPGMTPSPPPHKHGPSDAGKKEKRARKAQRHSRRQNRRR